MGSKTFLDHLMVYVWTFVVLSRFLVATAVQRGRLAGCRCTRWRCALIQLRGGALRSLF